jgi:hypothetical protein
MKNHKIYSIFQLSMVLIADFILKHFIEDEATKFLDNSFPSLLLIFVLMDGIKVFRQPHSLSMYSSIIFLYDS